MFGVNMRGSKSLLAVLVLLFLCRLRYQDALTAIDLPVDVALWVPIEKILRYWDPNTSKSRNKG